MEVRRKISTSPIIGAVSDCHMGINLVNAVEKYLNIRSTSELYCSCSTHLNQRITSCVKLILFFFFN